MSLDDQPVIDPDLAAAVRRVYVRPVDEATAQRHVNAVVAAATEAAGGETLVRRPGRRRPRARRRAWRSALAAGGAALLLPVGLAVAGVSLPSAVDDPYLAVGITLPHQPHTAPPATGPAKPGAATTTTEASPSAARHRRHATRARPHRRHGHASPSNSAGRQLGTPGASPAPPPAPDARATKPHVRPHQPTAVEHQPASGSPPAKRPHHGPRPAAIAHPIGHVPHVRTPKATPPSPDASPPRGRAK